tara:strand:+ start:509 stop:1510 length:1002 start_codon:yes stop_codon:yes gene_type:complete
MKTLINKKQKIFIAGAKGMVGSAVRRQLNFSGYKNLICPDRDEIDLTQNEIVCDWFKKNKPDLVIIAAAKVGGIYANNKYPANFLLENLKIQNNLIENSFQNNVKRLLFLGSSCIYPKNSIQPIKEEYLLSGELETTNEWYALAKISGLKLCQALRKQYGFDAISLMPTNLYGTGDNYHKLNSHVLPALIDRFHNHKIENKETIECWGSGKPKREFMHVDDLAKACIFALEQWDPDDPNAPVDKNGERLTWLNVGTGLDITIKELALLIKDVTSYEGNIKWNIDKPDGTYRKLLDTSKLKKMGWEAQIPLKEGLRMTYEDYKNGLKNRTLRKY